MSKGKENEANATTTTNAAVTLQFGIVDEIDVVQ